MGQCLTRRTATLLEVVWRSSVELWRLQRYRLSNHLKRSQQSNDGRMPQCVDLDKPGRQRRLV